MNSDRTDLYDPGCATPPTNAPAEPKAESSGRRLVGRIAGIPAGDVSDDRTSGRLAARAAMVDALLADRPGLAEPSAAQIAARAELHHVSKAAPASTANLLDDLREYLAQPQGWNPWPPTRS